MQDDLNAPRDLVISNGVESVGLLNSQPEAWYSREKAKLCPITAPCACGAPGVWDPYDAAWSWVECSAHCGKETCGYYGLDEAAEAWAKGEYQNA